MLPEKCEVPLTQRRIYTNIFMSSFQSQIKVISGKNRLEGFSLSVLVSFQ